MKEILKDLYCGLVFKDRLVVIFFRGEGAVDCYIRTKCDKNKYILVF